MFEGISVYGRDAGVDLIETFIESILNEALEAADAQKRSLNFHHRKTGKAALVGMVETLVTLTGLPVTEGNGVITIAWAKDKDEASLY